MCQTDAQLLAAAKLERTLLPPLSGAFEDILSRYEKLIFYIARRYFANQEDALDISQEVALKIYKGLPLVIIPEDGTLKSWICTIVARTCIDASRKRRHQLTELTDMPSNLPTPEETAATNEKVKEMLEAINKLPNDYRMAIILRDMEGLTYEEMAKTLGLNIGTVKSRLSRARASLKIMLN